ncbi:MAG TPA: serine hydrolase domain-containing protein [Caulifigura sp.]|nr:serine hydrolase domain-containing protein [Caulifigura sp.]
MHRRTFLGCGLALGLASPLRAAVTSKRFDDAAAVLEAAAARGQVSAAVLHVTTKGESSSRAFGAAPNTDAMFLLGSVSKPIAVTALMTLFDKGEFRLGDRVKRFLPQFAGEGRDRVTIRQLLTHTSGLPDQLPENDTLRKQHAQLPEFAEHALQTPLQFPPGSRYQYSSMGILLASRIAESISGVETKEFIEQAVLRPLGMTRSAQGLGKFVIEDFVPCQMEGAAPESGGGDPASKDWNWNSPFWRSLGAPWGGTHASGPDVGRFLDEFFSRRGAVVKPETAALMVSNRNPAGVAPRGLGFNVGHAAGSHGCSDRTFGHSGSTGTLAWADPATETICVVLTSLPARAAQPHPRELAGDSIAAGG